MDKPKILYHASANTDVEILEPRKESYRDPKEGPVVFATPNKSYASCFLVKTNDSWAHISRFGDTWHMIINDKERFMNTDIGGALYELPSETFYCDPHKGTGLSEWVSKESVKPLRKTIYKSGLEAMQENGVKVFFISQETFTDINNSSDHGYSIILSLKPHI